VSGSAGPAAALVSGVASVPVAVAESGASLASGALVSVELPSSAAPVSGVVSGAAALASVAVASEVVGAAAAAVSCATRRGSGSVEASVELSPEPGDICTCVVGWAAA
jgi:hypothetical protein